jgi:3D (Asp-Asp-Asp) domain-containing protein
LVDILRIKQWVTLLGVTFLLECIAYGNNPVIIAYGKPDQVVEVTATAYCACEICCGKPVSSPWYGITATGNKVFEGHTIAVDPSVIPLRSKVYIKGMGWYRAEDTGSSIKGERIDVYFNSHKEAQKFGVKKRKVYVYE